MNGFPFSAAALLPHAPPMLCVDALLDATATGAQASAFLDRGHILLHNGVLTRAGYVELAAQTAGAMKGYGEKMLGLPVKKGFLAAAQDFFFYGEAGEGDRLRIAVSLVAEVAGVRLLEAAIYRENAEGGRDLLAGGKLKVFVPEAD